MIDLNSAFTLGAALASKSVSMTPASNATFVQPTSIRTASVIVATGSGTVASGARSVAIANSGSAAGIVAGTSIAAGVALTWDAPNNDTLGAISYDATGTTFIITQVR